MFYLDTKTGDFIIDDNINLGDYLEVVPTGKVGLKRLYDFIDNSPEPDRPIVVYEFRVVLSSLLNEFVSEFKALSKAVQGFMAFNLNLADDRIIIMKSKLFKMPKFTWYSPVIDDKSIMSRLS